MIYILEKIDKCKAISNLKKMGNQNLKSCSEPEVHKPLVKLFLPNSGMATGQQRLQTYICVVARGTPLYLLQVK
jgi:hypothetical protein